MGAGDPGRYSLGQWAAVVTGWTAHHGGRKAEPPSDDEFETAITNVRM